MVPNPGSIASGSGGRKRGPGRVGASGAIGRTSRVGAGPPRASVVVIGYGVGQIIGHMAFETASRMRCPLGKTHEVKCISMSSVNGRPASIGFGLHFTSWVFPKGHR